VVYGLSVLVDAWGFLAVFFAAVALRQTELKLAGDDPDSPGRPQTSRIETEAAAAIPDSDPAPTVSGGSLVFKEHLERLSELMLVLLIGGTLFLDSWSWRAVGSPCSCHGGAPGQRPGRPVGHPHVVADTRHGRLVRGTRHRFTVLPDVCHPARSPEDLALELIQFTLIVVALSILAHGTSVSR